MKFEIVDVTPQLAAKWLQANTHNRKLNRDAVVSYAADMRAGQYSLTHQGIGFFEDGTLADGQHRLNAVVEAGVTVPMVVVFGVEATPHIDRARSRSISDCMAINGKPWIDKNVVAIVSCLDFYGRGRLGVSKVSKIAGMYEDEIKFVVSLLGKRAKGISHSGVSSACVAAIVCGVPRTLIERFYEILSSGIAAAPHEATVIRFRDFLLTKNLTGGGGMARKEVHLKAQRVIKAMCNKENLSKVFPPEAPIYTVPV